MSATLPSCSIKWPNCWQHQCHRPNALSAHKSVLVSRFGVTDLTLFGSTARDAAHPGSDVNVLVSFNGPASSAQYFGVLSYLKDLLGCAVDLVTQKALRQEIRPYIEGDAVYV